MNRKSLLSKIISWLFGIVVLVIGFINMFWGNDAGFGIFLAVLSLVYLLPVNDMVSKKFGFKIPVIAKVLLGVFIIWASLGVGELLEKIELAMAGL